MTLMERRRALMGQNGGGNVFPVKEITINQSVTNGSQISGAVNPALANAGITGNGVVYTAKPRSEWAHYEIAAFTVVQGNVAGQFWRKSGKSAIESRDRTSTYDGVIQAGTVFYFLEETP